MPIPMMPDGKCSYIVSAVNGKPGWFAVFRNVEMESSPKLRGTFYQLSVWSDSQKEFVQIEQVEATEYDNCWPTASDAVQALTSLLRKSKA